MRGFKRTLVIAGAALLLLGGAVAALLLLPGDSDPEPSPPVSEAPRGALIGQNRQTVKSVTITPPGADSFTIVYDSENDSYDMRDATDIFPYSDVYLSSTADYAFSQPEALIITEGASAGQLSAFGLDSPQLSWRVELNDASAIELELGAMTATQDMYYARVKGSGDVFAISASAGRALLKKEYEYYDVTLIPTYVDEVSQQIPLADTLTYLRLDRGGGDALEFRKRSDEELEGSSIGVSSFRMLSPYQAEANDYQLGELMSAKIQTILPAKAIAASPDDLAAYGLDRPARLELEDQEGWSLNLLIGGIDPETSGRYIMVEGSRAVLLDKNGDYSFLRAEPLSLRSTLVWIIDIKSISGVTYRLDGRTRELALDITDESEAASLDGVEIDVINAKRLYSRTLELTIDGVAEGGASGEAEYDITINLRDGTKSTLRLYRLNDRQYMIELDGETSGFYVGVPKVQRLLEGFQIIDDGGEIPW